MVASAAVLLALQAVCALMCAVAPGCVCLCVQLRLNDFVRECDGPLTLSGAPLAPDRLVSL